MATNTKATGAIPTSAPPRKSTKLHGILKQLRASKGANLERMVKSTGWQAHTVRAALSRLRQRGYTIERTPQNGKASRYHPVDEA